jgi:hypothetical protein
VIWADPGASASARRRTARGRMPCPVIEDDRPEAQVCHARPQLRICHRSSTDIWHRLVYRCHPIDDPQMVRRTLLVGCDTPRRRQALALLSGIGGPGAWWLHRAYLACNAEQVARGAAAPNSITGCGAQLRGYAVADLWFLTGATAGVILGLVRGVAHGRRRGTWTRPRSLPTAICTAVGICLAAPAFAVAYLSASAT